MDDPAPDDTREDSLERALTVQAAATDARSAAKRVRIQLEGQVSLLRKKCDRTKRNRTAECSALGSLTTLVLGSLWGALTGVVQLAPWITLPSLGGLGILLCAFLWARWADGEEELASFEDAISLLETRVRETELEIDEATEAIFTAERVAIESTPAQSELGRATQPIVRTLREEPPPVSIIDDSSSARSSLDRESSLNLLEDDRQDKGES